MKNPPVGLFVLDIARKTTLSDAGSEPRPLKKKRPVAGSNSSHGSPNVKPVGMGRALFMSTRAVRVPDLVHRDALLLTISRSEVGPAATIVSGGSRSLPAPRADTCWSWLSKGKDATCVNRGTVDWSVGRVVGCC